MTRRKIGLVGASVLAAAMAARGEPADFETFVPSRPVSVVVPPLPLTDLLPARPVASLMALRSARLLCDAVQHKCTNCDGSGRVAWQEQVGATSKSNQAWHLPAGFYKTQWWPVYETRSRPCTACDHGWASAKPEAQQKMAETQARLTAALEPQAPANAKTQGLAIDAFVRALTWDDQLNGTIRDTTRAKLAAGRVGPGDALAGSGTAAYQAVAGGRWVMRVDDRTVLVLLPRDAGGPEQAGAVVFGGIVSDVVTIGSVRYVVARRCLVRPPTDEGPPSWREDEANR